jgi:hypothetical protein
MRGSGVNPAEDDLDAGWDDAPAPANTAPSAPKTRAAVPRPVALTTPRAPSVRPKPAPSITPALPVAGESKQTSPSPVKASAVPRPRESPPPPPPLPVKPAASARVESPAARAVPQPADVPNSVQRVPVHAPPASAVASVAAQAADVDTLRPNEVEPPAPSTRRKGVARFVAALGIAAVMALASLAWLKDGGQTVMSQFRRIAAPATPREPEPAARPAPPDVPTAEARLPDMPLPPGAVITAVGPTPASPEVALAPPPPIETAESASGPLPAVVDATPAKRESTSVTIKTVPTGAAIFQAGKRLGRVPVELDVKPKTKHRLTALLDGHRPLNFTVDGTRDSVTIMLKPVSKSEASAPSDESADPPDTP